MEEQDRLFGLDALRAAAIVPVVLFHGALAVNLDGPVLRWLAFFGVEAFFVLSGFLVGDIILRDFSRDQTLAAAGRFWRRRWFRTLPNYFLFLLLATLLSALMRHLPPDAWRYAIFSQNLLRPPGYFFSISWSLAVEEWFYVSFPLLVLLFAAAIPRRPERSFLAAVLAFIAWGILLRLHQARYGAAGWPQVRTAVVFKIDAIAYGALGAYLRRCRPGLWASRPGLAALGGVVLLLVGLGFIVGKGPDRSLWARTGFPSAVSFSWLCLLPALSAWRSCEAPAAVAVTKLSLWSYSLYLCHPFLMPPLASVGALAAGPWLRGGLLAAYALLSVLVAASCFGAYESPMTRLRDRFA